MIYVKIFFLVLWRNLLPLKIIEDDKSVFIIIKLENISNCFYFDAFVIFWAGATSILIFFTF